MGSDESDIDDEDLGSEIDDELDSDLEEARKGLGGKGKKKASTPKKKNSKSADSDDDDDDSPKKGVKRKGSSGSKDPLAPKRGMSSFMLFSNAMRPIVKGESPDATFGEIAKIIGKKFKELSAEERKEWDAKSAKDKARYQAEMADYSAPEDDGSDGGGAGKKKKAKKDPHAPKGAMSAYMHYSVSNRARIKAENPEATFGDIVSDVNVLCTVFFLFLLHAIVELDCVANENVALSLHI